MAMEITGAIVDDTFVMVCMHTFQIETRERDTDEQIRYQVLRLYVYTRESLRTEHLLVSSNLRSD